jgi:hypothetical protein
VKEDGYFFSKNTKKNDEETQRASISKEDIIMYNLVNLEYNNYTLCIDSDREMEKSTRDR